MAVKQTSLDFEKSVRLSLYPRVLEMSSLVRWEIGKSKKKENVFNAMKTKRRTPVNLWEKREASKCVPKDVLTPNM